tara:strand:+ start:139 stop:300 length:162 start_codon:yes stop_codon:yes gene_type:complete
MTDKAKAKEYAERIAEINRQVEGGTVNFVQDTTSISCHESKIGCENELTRFPH